MKIGREGERPELFAGISKERAKGLLVNRRVLMVEDSESNPRVARGLLEQAVSEVVTAGNGLEVVAPAAEERFNGVLLG